MEMFEHIAKCGAIFIGLATIIAAVIGARSYAKFLTKAAHTLLFMKYTERYAQIMSSYPDNAIASRLNLDGEPPEASLSLTLATLRYLNLCSEEYYLWKKGLIEDGVWKIWEEELKRTISSPLYRREWLTLRQEFEAYPEFLSYVEQVQNERHHTKGRKTVDGTSTPERYENIPATVTVT